jgi:site-specific recombinase XerD
MVMNMSDEMILKEQQAIAELMSLYEKGQEAADQGKSDNTKRAYKSDWQQFQDWCLAHNVEPLPAKPGAVFSYLAHIMEELKPSSIQRRLIAIRYVHIKSNLPDPTKTPEIKELWRGICNNKGTRQTGKQPATIEVIRQLVAVLPDNLLGVRDRALLLVGFASAFRRSELVSLNYEDLTFDRNGLTVLLRRSKTDQTGEGRKVGIAYGSNPATCPVRALQDWLTAANIKDGAIFRPINRHEQIQSKRMTAQSVALIVKKYAELAGLAADLFAGHSLRAGLATSAAASGASERAIMNQTGHKNPLMVRRYIRDANLFNENVTTKIGL